MMDKIGSLIIKTFIIALIFAVHHYNALVPEHVRSYAAHPTKDILLLGAKQGIYLSSKSNPSDANLLIDMSSTSCSDNDFTVQKIYVTKSSDTHMEAYVLYQPEVLFRTKDYSTLYENCIHSISIQINDNDEIENPTVTTDPIINENFISNFEFRNGYFWVFKLDSIAVYFLNSNGQTIQYGNYQASTIISSSDIKGNTVMWGTRDGIIHKTTLDDVYLLNIKKKLLPVSREDTSIYVHPTKPIAYILGGIGLTVSAKLAFMEIDINSLNLNRYFMTSHSYTKPLKIYLDENRNVALFSTYNEVSTPSILGRMNLDTFEEFKNTNYYTTNVLGFVVKNFPYPLYKDELNSWIYIHGDTPMFKIFTWETCSLNGGSNCEKCAEDEQYCEFCLGSNQCTIKGQCDNIALNGCPSLSIIPSEISISSTTYVNLTGYGLHSDFEIDHSCTGIEILKNKYYQNGNALEFKVDVSLGSEGICPIEVIYSGNVVADLTFRYVDCSTFTVEQCISYKSVCGWCSQLETCTLYSDCKNGGFVNERIVLNLNETTVSNGDPLFIINHDKIPPNGVTCIIENNEGLSKSVPILNGNECLFKNLDEDFLNKPLTLHLEAFNGFLVSYYTGIEIYDCSAINICDVCNTKPKCQWCRDKGGIGECTNKDDTCLLVSRKEKCPVITSINPLSSMTKFPTLIEFTGSKLMDYNDEISILKCSVEYDDIKFNSISLQIKDDSSIQCSFSGSSIPDDSLGYYKVSLLYNQTRIISHKYMVEVYECDNAEYKSCYDCLLNKKECIWDVDLQKCSDDTGLTNKIDSFNNCPMITSTFPRDGIDVDEEVLMNGNFYCNDIDGFDLKLDNNDITIASNTLCVGEGLKFSNFDPDEVETPMKTKVYVDTKHGRTNSIDFSFAQCSNYISCGECNLYEGCAWCPSSNIDELSCKGIRECLGYSSTSTFEKHCNIKLEPDYGDTLGGDEIKVIGGPFYVGEFSPYTCIINNQAVQAQYCNDGELILTNCLICKTPKATVTGNVKFELVRNRATLYTTTFKYVSCITSYTSKGCHDSFCPIYQSPCGYCATNRLCTVKSRCQGKGSLFLDQCVEVKSSTQSYYDISIGGEQKMVFQTNPGIMNFYNVSSSSSSAICYFENIGGGDVIMYDAIVDDDENIECNIPLPSSLSSSTNNDNSFAMDENNELSFSLLLSLDGNNGVPLTNPLSIPYVDCTKYSTCSECKANPACGWCLYENKCSTEVSCSLSTPIEDPSIIYFAEQECPEIQSSSTELITEKDTEVVLFGKFFIEDIEVNISGKTYPITFISQSEISFVSPLLSGIKEMNLVDKNGKAYSEGFFLLRYSKDNSLAIGLGVGLTLSLLLVAAIVIFIVLYMRRRSKSGGISIRMVEPNYNEVAFGNDTLLKYKFPSKGLDDLEKALLREGFEFQILLEKSCDSCDLDELAKSFIRLTYHHNLSVECLSALSTNEIMRCDFETTIFRGNSLSSKMFTSYARMIGIRYLYTTIGRIIKELESLSDDDEDNNNNPNEASLLSFNIELDIDQMDDDEIIDEEVNVLSLKFTCQKIFNQITKHSMNNIPYEFKLLFHNIRESSNEKFGNDESYMKPVGGLFFLRFVCPALTCPHVYGLTQKPPNKHFQRQLILISKVIQSVANMTIPGTKEPYLIPMTDFVENNIPKVQTFYDQVSRLPSQQRNQDLLEVPESVIQNALSFTHNVLINEGVKNKMMKNMEDMDNSGELKEIYISLIESHGKIPKKKTK